ncbi:uncharacterized protein TRAVEDRAFT_48806 [Trametes versicolor FP-101664 SS1]|uniref:uncharacterized protein n=1 Tax=Trametes versicolor (strain FP-101664) TaxID=717944 RepID=UPI0004622635|nr:uncharacterized protein TRAVEDRAFT_48806 [Trametes versicolor FP-101664 SS1]EIW57776.1 hypothetical protein TRAVEDRAFT_48806 [Trametes versicolor FP-101664 SS1]
MVNIDDIRIVPTKDFLDKILPIHHSVLDKIYTNVTKLEPGLYGEERRWRGFPPSGEAFEEDQLYPPFVEAANKIADAARNVHKDEDDQVREAVWVDYHSSTPQPLDPDDGVECVRPDCALALGGMRSTIQELEDLSIPAQQKEALWWLQCVAPVEAKRDHRQNAEKLVAQLVDYLRLTMVKQQDRRFALGLILSCDEVSVWCLDRSGVLGMDVPIKIHENPREFVHVMAALAILPAHCLGFDPSMRLAREPRSPIHTYRLSSQGPDRFDIAVYKKNECATQWVITTEKDTFLTLKALSELRTDQVIGSGCVVWAVVRYDERHQSPDTRAVYVLKQWWKSEGGVDEGAMYEHLQKISDETPDPDAQYIGRMHYHETVKIAGEADSTDGLIQRGLKSAPVPPAPRPVASQKRYRDIDEDMELLHGRSVPIIIDDMVALYNVGPNATAPRKRTRMRVILAVFGCSMRFFTTLRELIELLLHGVRGHRFAYVHGVLHRDVSAANLLIAPADSGTGPQPHSQGVRGCLIDFGHAKRIQTVAERKISFEEIDTPLLPMYLQAWESPPGQVSEAVVQRAHHLIRLRYERSNPPEHPTLIGTKPSVPPAYYMMNVVQYIHAAFRYHKSSGLTPPADDVYTPEDLGWNTALLTPPRESDTTSNTTPKREPRSGTPPYASAKILNSGGVTVGRHDSEVTGALQSYPVVHDAIHDMESFFWVLLYICITRSGPGGDRRKELTEDFNAASEPSRTQILELRRMVHCFFDGGLEIIAWNKKDLFESSSKEFETHLLVHVHSYFEPLKPLLRQWWELLLLAYKFEGYEYHNIHKFVIELLERALEMVRELPANKSTDDEQRTRNAAKKRDDFVHGVTHANVLVRAAQVGIAEPPLSHTGIRTTAAFDGTLESEKQQAVGARDVPPSPTSPIKKKAKYVHDQVSYVPPCLTL